MWKIYHVSTGKLVKAGFNSEDQAKDWMETSRDIEFDDHDIEEMDEEEEEEYLEFVESSDELDGELSMSDVADEEDASNDDDGGEPTLGFDSTELEDDESY